MKFNRIGGALVWIATAFAFSPGAAAACERCFGAGVDSPIVIAIGFSMLTLLVLMGFVSGGIFSFFSQANTRAQILAQIESSTSDDPSATDDPVT